MVYIGIDVGGTGIQIGVVDAQGKILAKGGIVTCTDIPFEDQIAAMAACAKDVLDKSGYTMDDVAAVGAGVPGLADPRTGDVIFCTNLGWHNVPFRREFQKHMDKPVYIDNDATVAGLAESVAGVSAGTHSSVFITLGTGVGGGIVIGGKTWSGFHGTGSELGHMIIEMDGEPCTCGRRGCWETYSSATALHRQTKAAMQQNPDSLMWLLVDGDIDKVDGRIPFEAMKQGDAAGKAVVDRYCEYLACGLLNVINIFQPDVLCVGGGVCRQGENLLGPVRELIEDGRYSKFSEKQTKLCVAELGNDAGIVGAACLGRHQ